MASPTALVDPVMGTSVRALSLKVGLKLISFTLLPDNPLRADTAKVGNHMVIVVLMVPTLSERGRSYVNTVQEGSLACNTAILISCVARATAWFDPEMEISVRMFSSMVGLKSISALEVLHMSFTLLPDGPLRAGMAKVGTHIVDVVLMVPAFI